MVDFMETSPQGRGQKKKVRVRSFGVSVLLLCVLVTGSARPAHACSAVLGGLSATALATVTALIEEAYLLINAGFTSLTQPHVLYSNQMTNNHQRQNNYKFVQSDRTAAVNTSSELSRLRSEIAREMAIPSRVACRKAVLQQNFTGMDDFYKEKYESYQKDDVDFSLNATTDTKLGTLAALDNAWEYRCGTYADVSNMNIPSGVSCAGGDPDLVNLDLKPMEAILSPDSYKGQKYATAARDAARMLIQIAPDDPLRGVALTRTSAQNIHAYRMQELSRMNLSRMIVNSAIANRLRQEASDATDGRDLSRRERFREMFEGQGERDSDGYLKTDPSKNLADLSGKAENSNVQAFASGLDGYQLMLLRLIEMSEQMVAVEAARLASVVDETGVAGNMQMRFRATNN